MMTGRAAEATVSTLMAEAPVVVGEDETIASVAELLAGYEISGLPVVDASDQLVGVISETDLVRLRGWTLPWTAWHGVLVRTSSAGRPGRSLGPPRSTKPLAR